MAKRYNPRDRYYQRAKKEGFAARSVYKLEEIDARLRLFKKGQRVVDLGCSPGSWLQYISGKITEQGLVIAYDLDPPRVAAGPQARVFQADAFDLTPERLRADAELGEEERFDALVSDMAPKTTGIRDSDQARSIALVEHALWLADGVLVSGGVFAAKTFQGRGFDALLNDVKKRYADVKALRPKATRQGSREAFIVARLR